MSRRGSSPAFQNFAESGPSIECDGPNRSIYDFEGNLHVLRASIPSDMHKVLQMARASGSDESETHVAFSLSQQSILNGTQFIDILV